MKLIIRLALTALLLVKSYSETGPWTVALLALIVVGNELLAFGLKRWVDADRHEQEQ